MCCWFCYSRPSTSGSLMGMETLDLSSVANTAQSFPHSVPSLLVPQMTSSSCGPGPACPLSASGSRLISPLSGHPSAAHRGASSAVESTSPSHALSDSEAESLQARVIVSVIVPFEMHDLSDQMYCSFLNTPSMFSDTISNVSAIVDHSN